MKNNKTTLIIISVVIVVVVAIAFLINAAGNKAISMEEQILAARSDVEVQEKRRADLIPNLVNTVKAYDQHEYDLMLAIVKERGTDDEAVSEIQTMIAAVAEAYPELNSNENYKQLMTELAMTENSIASYRKAFNDLLREYNSYCKRFPHPLMFSITKYEVKTYEYLDFNASEDAQVVFQ